MSKDYSLDGDDDSHCCVHTQDRKKSLPKMKKKKKKGNRLALGGKKINFIAKFAKRPKKLFANNSKYKPL